MTLAARVVERVRKELVAGGVVYADQEALWLVEAASGLDRVELTIGRVALAPEAEAEALAYARRRAGGEPLQYVTGIAHFRHLELCVGPGVFIPRPETELVAERAIELLPLHGTAVDVGTGSGAIAIAIATERPDAHVYATESSRRAFDYAKGNAVRCGAAVDMRLCDLLTGLPERLRAAVDVCVSNPPYVPPSEGAALPRDVVAHEPAEALFAEVDGLGTIARLAAEARAWLRQGGWLVLEIGEGQGDAVSELLRRQGYADVSTRRDLTGRTRIAEGRA